MVLLTGREAANMTMKELRAMVKPVFKAARQCANRMFKSDKIEMGYSPALRAAQKSKPTGQVSLFESRGKTRNELLMEYARAKAFLSDETSTVKGTMKYVNSITEAMNNKANISGLDNVKTMEMLKVLDKLSEEHAWVENIRFKYEVFEAIKNEMEKDQTQTADEVVTNVENMLDRIYQANVGSDEFYDVF